MTTDNADDYALHLYRVLARIDLATRHPRYTCADCGCLCLHGETCPACAVAATRKDAPAA